MEPVNRTTAQSHGKPLDGKSTPMIDPLASFETSGPETPWEQEQTRRAITLLHGHPKFDEVLHRVREYRSQPQPPKAVEVRGTVVFTLQEATASTSMSILRADGKSAPVVLFQVGSDEASRRTQIDFMRVSPSGHFIAIGTSDAGTEETLVRVLDARTGRDLGDRSQDVQLEQLVWLADDSAYLYLRGRGSKNVSVQDRIRDISVALHTMGKPAELDPEIVGARAPGKRINADFEDPYPSLSPNGKDAIISVRRGVNPDLIIHHKKFANLFNTAAEWHRLYDEADHVRSTALTNGQLIAIRCGENDLYTVEQTLLDAPYTRKTLYSSKNPLEDVIPNGNELYVVERELATKHLVTVRENGESARVRMPSGTSVRTDTIRLDPSSGKLVTSLASWTEPSSWWAVSKNQQGMDRLLNVPSSYRGDGYEARTLDAPARDGQRIPLTIVGPKDQGGAAPKFVWVSAYGAYGYVSGPVFTIARRIFLEFGGTYIWAHVRGGGEKGRAWHEEGRGAKKLTTVNDTIDAVKFLRGRDFGHGGGIFLGGASAGGIAVGGLLVREPNLVNAAFIDAGPVNVSRMEAEASAAGAIHRQEYGSEDTPEAARALREIDAYLNVRDGVAYPATMLRTGLNDPRVPRWQSSKLAARLQKATTGTKPILLRLTGGGHGTGNTHDESIKTQAELVTFALTNINHPQFQ